MAQPGINPTSRTIPARTAYKQVTWTGMFDFASPVVLDGIVGRQGVRLRFSASTSVDSRSNGCAVDDSLADGLSDQSLLRWSRCTLDWVRGRFEDRMNRIDMMRMESCRSCSSCQKKGLRTMPMSMRAKVARAVFGQLQSASGRLVLANSTAAAMRHVTMR